jgi:peptidoglycan/xylan/chitin deacetylase (PgdA/CDA1 family)
MWPNGAQCAVAFTFDFDAETVWLANHPENADRPGVLSQGQYGPRVGLPLILSLLRNQGIPATFFVPGRVAEDHPDSITAILSHNHELAAHGYTHTPPDTFSRQEEENELLRARATLEAFGEPISGYRSPEWAVSPHTVGLMAAHGFAYASNLMNDLRPYLHPGTNLIELPVHWTLDDAAHFSFDSDHWTRKIATPSEVLEIWRAEFEGIYELGAAFILTLHPQIIGRPHRLALLADFITFVKSHQRAWLATCAEIATAARCALSPDSTPPPR